MKILSLATSLLFAAASMAAYGSTITVGNINLVSTADSIISSSYGLTPFYNYNSYTANDTISQSQLASDLTDTNTGTYVFSTTYGANVQLGFSTPIYNGAGSDIDLFFVGTGYTVGVTINGTKKYYNPGLIPNDPQKVLVQSCDPLTNICSSTYYNLTVAQINLDDFGYSGSNTPVTSFTVDLGDASRPALSLAGSVYSSPTFPTTPPPAVVPLPLSSMLFASGLGALGLISRKRNKKQA